MAPEIGVRIEDAVRARRLRVLGGRLKSLTAETDRLHLEIKLRSQQIVPLDVERLINCTGPESEYQRLPDPLIRSLLESGRARASSIGPGLWTDGDRSLVDSDGNSSAWLFAVGPPNFGALFETTAVPELRIQAESLANYLLSNPYKPVEAAVLNTTWQPASNWPNGSSWGGAGTRALVAEKAFQRRLELRYSEGGYVPDLVQIDADVIVDQNVAHTADRFPVQSREVSACVG